jgi:hypothetical protein
MHPPLRNVRTSAFNASALFLALALSGTSARAQTASDRETARTLMEEGFQKRDKGDMRGALERFQLADQLMHVPTTGLEVARAQVALGLLTEARGTLQAVVRSAAKPAEPAVFGVARASAAQLDEDLAGRIPALKIVVRGSPEGSALSVAVDGVDVPPATLVVPRKVNPGAHTLIAKAGGREAREQAMLKERETREIVLNLSPEPPAPPPPPPPPPPPTSPQPGSAQEPAHSASALNASTMRMVSIGGFALGAVGVAVGAVEGIRAIVLKNSAQSGCTSDNRCPPATYDDIDSSRTAGTISTVAFIVGAVGVGVGVAALVLSMRKSDQAAAPVASRPWIGIGNAGVQGRF